MKTLNIFSITAFIFLAVLIALMLNLRKPMEQQYEALVESIMDEHGFTDETEMLDQFPELLELEQQIQALQYAHHDIQQTVQQPMPPVKEQSLALAEQIKDLKTKRKKLEIEMRQMMHGERQIALGN
ncbi:MAG: hypothetical protein HRU41_02575 [Saprospiraceae bacterium]|nr:hypothetical protein [Saprospiraceae bacterium]